MTEAAGRRPPAKRTAMDVLRELRQPKVAVMLALVPRGLYVGGGHSWRGEPGKYPFSHYLLGQTVVTCGLVARLYLLDKRNFLSWMARRVSAKTKMA